MPTREPEDDVPPSQGESRRTGFYAIHGIRFGATIAPAKRVLHTIGPFHVGRNDWYVAANGSSTAVLKVRGGIVQEIGIGIRALTSSRGADKVFVKSFS